MEASQSAKIFIKLDGPLLKPFLSPTISDRSSDAVWAGDRWHHPFCAIDSEGASEQLSIFRRL